MVSDDANKILEYIKENRGIRGHTRELISEQNKRLVNELNIPLKQLLSAFQEIKNEDLAKTFPRPDGEWIYQLITKGEEYLNSLKWTSRWLDKKQIVTAVIIFILTTVLWNLYYG